MYLTSYFISIFTFVSILQITHILAKSAYIQELHQETFEFNITEEINQIQVLEILKQHSNITSLILHSVQNPFIFHEKVELRNLQNFVLLFQNNFDYTHSFWTEDPRVKSRIIEAGFPFSKNGQAITLENILKTGLNIEVRGEFDTNAILKINHTTSEIDSRYTSILNLILVGSHHFPGLKKLAVGIYSASQEPLSVALIPNTLEHLELDTVEFTNGTLDDLLKKLTTLKNLYMDFSRGSGQFSISSLPKYLKSVFLYNIDKLEYGDGVELPNLEGMYLYEITTLDPKVIQNFDKIFPSMKYLVLWQYFLEILPRLARISSMEEVSITAYENDCHALTANEELQNQFGPSFSNCVKNDSLCSFKKTNNKWMLIRELEDLTSRFHFDRVTLIN